MRDEMSSLSSLNLKEVKIKGMNQWGEADDNYDDKIPDYALYNQRGLVSIVLPDQLKKIGYCAFRECTNLSGSLIIPEGVVEIKSRAFEGCSNLKGTLSLPSTLEILGSNDWALA